MSLSADYSTTKPVRAEDLQEIIDAIEDLLAAAWAPYTPVWTSDGTQPVLGSSTLTGGVRKPADGNIQDVRFKFTKNTGGGSSNGTGAYFFSVPQGAAHEVGTDIGTWYMTSGGQHYSGTLRLQTATTALLVRDTGVVLHNTPVTLANGDIITGRARYEPA